MGSEVSEKAHSQDDAPTAGQLAPGPSSRTAPHGVAPPPLGSSPENLVWSTQSQRKPGSINCFRTGGHNLPTIQEDTRLASERQSEGVSS